MYLVSERHEKKDVTNVSKMKICKLVVFSIYVIAIVLTDLLCIKKNAFSRGKISFTSLYVLLGYFIVTEVYALYSFLLRNKFERESPQKQTSYFATFFWHFSSFTKLAIFGICLSSDQNRYISTYFCIRFAIYGLTFYGVLSHLKRIKYFLINKGEVFSLLLQERLWQLQHFQQIYYAALIGITVDLVSFGNDTNYYVWIGAIFSWIIYEFNKIMIKNNGWKHVSNIFQSE